MLMTTLRRVLAVAAIAATTFAHPAFAQDDDFDLDDILAPDEEPAESTIKEEKDAVRTGDIDDLPGSSSGPIETPDEAKRGRIRPIKVLQPKEFLKIGRWEATPTLGFVTNDPFVRRYLLGAGFTYHITEVFGAEVRGIFSPDLGPGDYKKITHQLIEENQVSPDISKIIWLAELNTTFSPFYGKVAVNGRSIVIFDLYGIFGFGLAGTADDLDALQGNDDPLAEATANQVHATSNVGGGVRMAFSRNIAVRFEARSTIFIETVNSTTLEMKNNFHLNLGFSFFFPGLER